MGQVKTLGGDRLGSGKKQKIQLHGYERSTHDLGYLWRSSMAAGTLVPYMCEVALPGDTFDIDLNAVVMTHPTVGPLFGSYKLQLDVFQAPIRLYQGLLHNNKLGIGMNMSNVKLPLMQLTLEATDPTTVQDWDNQQVNPSCIFSYLGIRGIASYGGSETPYRSFNAVPWLAYWDIYKNYYANKQEEIGAFIHTPLSSLVETVTSVKVNGTTTIPQTTGVTPIHIGRPQTLDIAYTGTVPILSQIIIQTDLYGPITADTGGLFTWTDTGTEWKGIFVGPPNGIHVYWWDYKSNGQPITYPPTVKTFDLSNLDTMRESILKHLDASPYIVEVTDTIGSPYADILTWVGGQNPRLGTQEGLALKTYQSDLFNNWLQTEWIDGTSGINAITAIDTSTGSFTLDTLNLSKKVYEMLNRIAVSGGSYDDWLDAVYDHDRITRAETPIYHGGLSKEVIFNEVISNAAAATDAGNQPLGTLAGRGTMAQKHKGGKIVIRIDEPSYIIGIVSLTPRIDYSQGNKWDTGLKTLDDLHKPALDEIGFQELIVEQMAWWSTALISSDNYAQQSAGKQPAWINYMTNVNQVRGNFAIQNNEMFMTLNRRYEPDPNDITNVLDLTTYIDPSKFNFIFAQTSLDAQNFWTQIAVDITARRKMSAKVMPNL